MVSPAIERVIVKHGGAAAVSGRLLLIFSTDGAAEPRFQINAELSTQQIFGIDVLELAPGATAGFDAGVLGYPRESLAEIGPGNYFVQAVLHVYETVHRADGHTLLLPMDRGEGQQWS